MKKLYLLWLLPFSLQFLHAQNYILQGVTGVTGPTGTTGSTIYQDANALIGIGTTTPIANLDVTGTSSAISSIIAVHYTPATGYTPDYIDASHYTGSAYNIDFNVNPLGQVGIGRVNDAAPMGADLLIQTHEWTSWGITGLVVNGMPLMCMDDHYSGLFAVINNGSSSNSSGCAVADGNSNLEEPTLCVFDNGNNLSNPPFMATGNGIVMIGTSSPVAQVDINNNMYADGSYTPLENLFHVGDESISKDYLTVANNSNVEVGIGMKPTGGTLSIKGTEGTALNIYETNGVGDIEWYGADGNLRHAIWDDVSGTGDLVIWPGIEEGTVPLQVAGTLQVNENEFVTGQLTVGLNTAPTGLGSGTFASAILSVDGQLAAKEIVVTTTSWSDTVFSNTYHLKTLNEVENYINLNHHLPGVPSAKEVIKDGISLGDMNKILLQKVEELTLYVMKQQKEIDELKSEK